MFDKDGATPGTWEKAGNTIVARFDGGRIVYTGTVSNFTYAGTAKNEKTSWSFTVRNLEEAIRHHDANPPDLYNTQAVADYNAEAQALDAEGSSIKAAQRR
jgi:hypothetical protein